MVAEKCTVWYWKGTIADICKLRTGSGDNLQADANIYWESEPNEHRQNRFEISFNYGRLFIDIANASRKLITLRFPDAEYAALSAARRILNS